MHRVVAGVLVVAAVASTANATWKDNQAASLVQAQPMDASAMDYFGNMLDNERHLREVLRDILVPRVAGTPAKELVRNAIERRMRSLGWQVEINSHTQETVIGKVSFHNVVATLDPAAPRRLVLACHYDSKMTPQGFLGAIDSAVPCAQLIDLAYTLRRDLQDSKGNELTLQLLFFDGEEAFATWSATDSLYGSRNLAKVWHEEPYSFGGVETNTLGRIDAFVLLDLIGAKDTQFVALKAKTQTLYDRLRSIESQLFISGALSSYSPRKPIFADEKEHSSSIQDDHMPFEDRGVPILHLISYPFPKVWHTMEDNANAIDFDIVTNLNKMLRVFVAQYLRL